MRRITINTRAIEEVRFTGNDTQCNSWGDEVGNNKEPDVDGALGDGFELALRAEPHIQGIDPITLIRRGPYSVIINTSRLSDVILNEQLNLAIFYQNRIVSGLRVQDAVPWADVMSRQRERDDSHIYAVTQRNGWAAVVAEPITALSSSFRQELLRALPTSLIIGLLIAALAAKLFSQRRSPLSELKSAVQQREFVVHYQPIIALNSGECVGAEALVRWIRPDGSMVSPDKFIPLAEDSGLILAITDQVIKGVVDDLEQVLANNRGLHIAINLCADDIKSGRFIPVIETALQNGSISHEQIWLEATERGFIDIDAAVGSLQKAKALGFHVAIDDFGTGYSSLQHLQRLPIDVLKIDKAFVDTIGTSSASSSVITHIIAMAKTLNLEIVAEGVETEAQANYLKAQGVEYAQGWLYSKALPAKDFVNFLG
jgi:sensor c-di-GMP phosphodiesterase-like protein